MNITKSILYFVLLFMFSCNSSKFTEVDLKISELSTQCDASLRGLFVIDENVIWASGTKGTVLVSENGGENWNINQISRATENDFRSIHAWDKNRAIVFAIAGPAFGFLTENGGESWNVVFQDTTKGLFFNSLKFANEKVGLAVSDPVGGKLFVIRTENGGGKWERVSDIPEIIEGEANFAASNTCIEFLPSGKAWMATGGKVARIFYSVDFGKSWKVSETPIISGSTSSGIFSVSFKNELEGVIVGGTYDHPEQNKNIAAYTQDGGKTWQSSLKMPAEYRSCTQFVSFEKENFFLAVGKTGFDFSLDSGKNWHSIKSNDGYYTFRPVPGKFLGFVAGSEGRISKISFSYQAVN